jgi:hypothetical protein
MEGILSSSTTHNETGLASLEAALFIGFIFLPFFVGAMSLWSYFTLVDTVQTHVAQARNNLAAVNLQLHTGLRGTFPREHKLTEEENSAPYSPYATYQNAAKSFSSLVKTQRGIKDVKVEVGYLSARLVTADGSSLVQQFGDFELRRTNGTPSSCNRWKQPGSESTLVICGGEIRPQDYRNSSLWSLFKHHVSPESPRSENSFSGKAWTAHSYRRLQRGLGSSVWLSKFEREGRDVEVSIDGNDYAWPNHPRFGVISGYAIVVTLDNVLFSIFQQTDSPTLVFFGLLPVRQEF